MATNNNLGDLLTAIADAIRGKKKSTSLINAQDFPSEIANLPSRNEYGNDGTVDAAGLRELGWNENDIAWLQKVCWWDAEDNEKWKVTDANKAFGPNGATPITWANLSTFAGNLDIVFFPKLANTTTNYYVNVTLPNLLAIPTDGWTYFNTGSYHTWAFYYNPQLISVGDLNNVEIYVPYANGAFNQARNLRFKDWFKPNQIIFERYCFGSSGDGQNGACNGFEKLDFTNIDWSEINDVYAWFGNSTVQAMKFDVMNNTNVGTFNIYQHCPRLKEIYVNEITVSWTFGGCPNLSRESCLRIFNALSTSEVGTITLESSVKARLTPEDIAIATAKGWTIA